MKRFLLTAIFLFAAPVSAQVTGDVSKPPPPGVTVDRGNRLIPIPGGSYVNPSDGTERWVPTYPGGPLQRYGGEPNHSTPPRTPVRVKPISPIPKRR